MKQNILKYISIALSIIILTVLFYSCGMIARAEVPQSQIVVGHTAVWNGYPFTFTLGGKYYTLQDTTGVPTSTALNPKFFYTQDNIVFDDIDGLELYTIVLNKQIGVIVKDTVLNNLYNSFMTLINILDSNNNYLQGGLYDNSGNFIGYCLNDISGCYYQGESTTQITVTNDYSNDVYNHYNYYNDEHFDSTDFFTYEPPSESYIINQNGNAYFNQQVPYLQSFLSTYDTLYGIACTPNTPSTCWVNNPNYGFKNVEYAVFSESTSPTGSWDTFCSRFKLDSDNHELFFSDWNELTTAITLYLNLYDSSNNLITTCDSLDYNTGSASEASKNFNIGLWRDSYNRTIYGKKITIYKDLQTKTGLDNQTYSADTYYTDSYNTYDTLNDNSFTATVYQVDNSVVYNNAIYSDSNDSFYEYYDNGYYDTSSSQTNITNITNNYYSGQIQPDTPDNPDNPDDPNNPDNPDGPSTLDEILQAILRFFNAIGDIIGTILASLINLISAVLEALSGAIESVTGISEIFGTLFSWIPEPVPQILGAGFSICLICGIIKFIRG